MKTIKTMREVDITLPKNKLNFKFLGTNTLLEWDIFSDDENTQKVEGYETIMVCSFEDLSAYNPQKGSVGAFTQCVAWVVRNGSSVEDSEIKSIIKTIKETIKDETINLHEMFCEELKQYKEVYEDLQEIYIDICDGYLELDKKLRQNELEIKKLVFENNYLKEKLDLL